MKKSLVGAGLIAWGLALSACGAPPESPVPPHLERIEYLERNLVGLYRDVDSDYFDKVIFVYDNGGGTVENLNPETQYGTLYVMLEHSNFEKPLHFELLSIRDHPFTENDGTFDEIVLMYYDATDDEEWKCQLWRYQITDDDLIERIDLHYDRSTEEAYRALTEGKESYSTVIGEREWKEFRGLCGH